jgi:chloramphenicol-sensitive protein RarD
VGIVSRNERFGYLYGLGAYLIWGFFPLYIKLLRPAGAVEILAHRVIWSAVFVALLLTAVRRWSSRRRELPHDYRLHDRDNRLHDRDNRPRDSNRDSRVREVPRDSRLRELVQRPRLVGGILVAALLIAVNWGTYIYGVNSNRVVETSLGYFITPLVTVLLGVLALHERLRVPQWVALSIGAVAVGVLTVDYGQPPFIALTLAASFSSYGLVKKRLGLPAAEGLMVESGALAGPALGYLVWLTVRGHGTFGQGSAGHTALLVLAGVVTAIPLMLFAGAANRIPLSSLGILQYAAPILQLASGVLVYHEPMPPARLAGFALVWAALMVFTVDGLRHARGRASTEPASGDLAAGHPEPPAIANEPGRPTAGTRA